MIAGHDPRRFCKFHLIFSDSMAKENVGKVTVKCTYEQSDTRLWGGVLLLDSAHIDILKQWDRRVICEINNKIRFHCSLMPDGSGGLFIMLNKSRKNKLGLVEGSEVWVDLLPDHSKYGMPISDELVEVLEQDAAAARFFEALTPGKKRTLIYWVDLVKNPATKIRRGLVMCDHLKQNRGKIDFKQLNEEMKLSNRNFNIK
ncbi:MAG: hypothetical protein Kow0075_03920 [Salibacteraceae bacterium]